MDLEAAREATLGREQGLPPSRKSRLSRALEVVFRFRYALHLLVYLGGFAISWAGFRGLQLQRVWLALPEVISRFFGTDLNRAIVAVTTGAILFAAAAALLRTWGTAYLGAGAVTDSQLHGQEIAVRGPYRYVRNPLYLGTLLHTLALCVLMSWAGAIFTLVATLLLQVGMVAAEEEYLAGQAPVAYNLYRQRVRRFLPHVLHPEASPGGQAQWGRAVLCEIYMWGAAISFTAFGSSYNALPILQGLLVSLGVSIVVHGLMSKRAPAG